MEQRISLITLGVSDLSRAKRFYEALGWRGQEVEQTVFFQAGGMAVVLWGEDQLAADAGLAGGQARAASSFRGVALAQNVRSKAEVDSTIAAARSAGAAVTREPAETFYGGYAGYFTDLDGHAWEVAHNPGFTLAEDGSLTLPDFGAA
jgi:predicted lactoylglutathione lyase